MMRTLLVTIAVIVAPIATNAACLSYEGPQTITGVLSVRSFPGAPNYESIADGDEDERVPILTLARPACVDAAGADDPTNEAVPSLETVQVIVPGGKVDRKLVGRKVVATGEIFHSHTGHHHAPILIEAKVAKAAKQR